MSTSRLPDVFDESGEVLPVVAGVLFDWQLFRAGKSCWLESSTLLTTRCQFPPLGPALESAACGELYTISPLLLFFM